MAELEQLCDSKESDLAVKFSEQLAKTIETTQKKLEKLNLEIATREKVMEAKLKRFIKETVG